MTALLAAPVLAPVVVSAPSPRPPLRLPGLALAMLLPSLATSSASIALPSIAATFGATFDSVQWILLSYLIAVTALVVGAGRLGDRLGRSRLLLAGIALFTFSSLLCAVSPSLALLLVARVGQGAGAAVMVALALALVGESTPAGRQGSAIGLLGSMSAAGTMLGPVLGGVLIAAFGWRALFLVNVPLGLLAFLVLVGSRKSGDDRRSASAAFDWGGSVSLAVTVSALALAATAAGDGGLALAAALLVATAGAVSFVRLQSTAVAPLLPPALLGDPILRSGLASSLLVAAVMMAMLLAGPFYLSRTIGLDPLAVGLVMALAPLTAALAAFPAGRAVDRRGESAIARLGLAAMQAGLAALVIAPIQLGLPAFAAGSMLVAGGHAFFQTANNKRMIVAAPDGRQGLVSGLLGLSRNLGLIVGAAALGALFAGAAGADAAEAPPEAIAVAARATFLAAALLVLIALAVTARRPLMGGGARA